MKADRFPPSGHLYSSGGMRAGCGHTDIVAGATSGQVVTEGLSEDITSEPVGQEDKSEELGDTNASV